MRYIINLTNAEDVKNSGPSSFGTGKYGFQVSAINMAEAKQKILARAEKDGFSGWSAKITRLKDNGQIDTGCDLSAIFDKERESVIERI